MEADQRFTEAVSLARGIDRSERVPAAVLLNHARTLALLDRGNEAMDLLGRVRGQGELSPSLDAFARLVEAQLLVERGDVEGARKLHDSLSHPDSPLSAAYAHVVPILAGQIARAEGRIAEARGIIDGVIEVSKRSPALAYAQPETLEYAARLAIEGRDLETAIRLTREAIRVADAEFGTATPSAHAGRARLTLGIALAMKGLAQDAKTEYQRAAADLEQTAGAKHSWTAEARTRLTAAIP